MKHVGVRNPQVPPRGLRRRLLLLPDLFLINQIVFVHFLDEIALLLTRHVIQPVQKGLVSLHYTALEMQPFLITLELALARGR